MNPASRSCRRLQRSILNSRAISTRFYATRKLPGFLQCLNSPQETALSISCQQAQFSGKQVIRRASNMASGPQFAEGINPEQLRPQLGELQGQAWGLDEDKSGITKTFYFRSYFKAAVSNHPKMPQSKVKLTWSQPQYRVLSMQSHRRVPQRNTMLQSRWYVVLASQHRGMAHTDDGLEIWICGCPLDYSPPARPY